jgi:hypothetical protein
MAFSKTERQGIVMGQHPANYLRMILLSLKLELLMVVQ